MPHAPWEVESVDSDAVANDDVANDDETTSLLDLFAFNKEGELLRRLRTPGVVTDKDLATLNEDGDSVLSLAATYGNLPLVQAIAELVSSETLRLVAWTTLQRAVINNQVEVLTYLWDVIPNAATLTSSTTGNSLLHEAAECSGIETLLYLISRFPDLNLRNEAGETPYLAAKRKWAFPCAWHLEKAGANVYARANNGDTLCHYIIRYAFDEDALYEILEGFFGEDHTVDVANEAGERPIDLTTNPRIKALLSAEVDFRSAFPVHVLVRTNNVDRFDTWLADMRRDHPHDADDAITAALALPDSMGRTPLMHAARMFEDNRDTTQVLHRILEYISADVITAKDHEGHTALDMLMHEMVICAVNTIGANTAYRMRAIYAVARQGHLPLDCTHLPPEYHREANLMLTGTAPRTCIGDCMTNASSTSELVRAAAGRKWKELSGLLDRPRATDVLNQTDDWKRGGYTALHHVCRCGHVASLQLLLEQPDLDLNIESFDGKTALELAVNANFPEIVRRLLDASADPKADDDLDESKLAALCASATESQRLVYEYWALSLFDRGFYLANVGNVATAREMMAQKQTPMHAAMHVAFAKAALDEIAMNVDLDQQDINGETALMVAAKSGNIFNVDYLIAKDVNLDLEDNEDRSALLLAAMKGDALIVEILLQHGAEIYDDDDDRSTLARFAQLTIVESDELPPPEFLWPVRELLENEIKLRRDSPAFQQKRAFSMVTMSIDDVFYKGGFAKAIALSPKLGLKFLNDCVTLHRHEAEFLHLEAVYGQTTKKSALQAVLDLDLKDVDKTFATQKALLEHIVFRRLLDVKWKLFGQRLYFQQLLTNVLLLFTMATSSFYSSDVAPSMAASVFGLSTCVLIGFAYLTLKRLAPRTLYGDARYLRYGRRHFQYAMSMTFWEHRVSVLTRRLAGVFSALCVVALAIAAPHLHLAVWYPTFNTAVLLFTALYFVLTERQEMKAGYRIHFQSHTNKAQLLVYLTIITVFVPIKLNWFPISPEIEFGLSGFLTLALWVLSLQFLETEAANRAAWSTLVDELDATIDKELDFLRDALQHVQHFTSLTVSTIFADDLKHIGKSRSQLNVIVDDARKSNGEFRDKVLAALQSHLKKKLGQLKDKLLRLWAPKFDAKDMSARAECMLLFQMAQRSTMDAQLQKVSETVLDVVLARDLEHIETARALLKVIIETARLSCGVYRDMALAALQKQVKRTLTKLKEKLLTLWKLRLDAAEMDARAECVLLYNMSQRSTIKDELQKVIDAIENAVQNVITPPTECNDDGDTKPDDKLVALEAKVEAQSKQLEAVAAKLDAILALVSGVNNNGTRYDVQEV
ncbi:hypothetical protein SDRG_11142 [Saprolegnia diclina VS20]|uniref:Uncharacterized protein n=1 Tax=Saprolegnia diclina (strain VS20) TaxID=1156394 RepID=T0Q048_SAPDV|nr:hypothetical protein SDRG_11142 [Saprolegnia diclina VS20]EQC31219.1 hypothetical protein SDRG_11142 [Saprolegnia diclina VS20]|eukprot:XP_008615392.1 hypothetical protein SDRG_11142 [Saprolegnia diclina VS20]